MFSEPFDIQTNVQWVPFVCISFQLLDFVSSSDPSAVEATVKVFEKSSKRNFAVFATTEICIYIFDDFPQCFFAKRFVSKWFGFIPNRFPIAKTGNGTLSLEEQQHSQPYRRRRLYNNAGNKLNIWCKPWSRWRSSAFCCCCRLRKYPAPWFPLPVSCPIPLLLLSPTTSLCFESCVVEHESVHRH